VANALDPIYQRIHHIVIEGQFCKHFDETTWRDSGKRHYVWLASCSVAAFFAIDRFRNMEAFRKLVGKDPTNLPSVTDRYAVYNSLGELHQYCLAHLIRDFRKYAERDGPDGIVGTGLVDELTLVCKIHAEYREGKITLKQRNMRLGHRKRKVTFWFEDGMANATTKLFRLCEKLLDEFDHLWVFTKVEGMEPTNNLAERDLRKLVVWRKKSNGTRSERGKRFVERITSVAQTLKRQGVNILHFVQKAVISFFNNESAPLICPDLAF